MKKNTLFIILIFPIILMVLFVEFFGPTGHPGVLNTPIFAWVNTLIPLYLLIFIVIFLISLVRLFTSKIRLKRMSSEDANNTMVDKLRERIIKSKKNITISILAILIVICIWLVKAWVENKYFPRSTGYINDTIPTIVVP